jgi:hypothetical protein
LVKGNDNKKIKQMNILNSAPFLLVPYIVFSIFIGFLGKHKQIGRLNASVLLVFISLILTPLVGLIFLSLAKVSDPFEEETKQMKKLYKCEYCMWKFEEKFEYCPHCNKKAEEN